MLQRRSLPIAPWVFAARLAGPIALKGHKQAPLKTRLKAPIESPLSFASFIVMSGTPLRELQLHRHKQKDYALLPDPCPEFAALCPLNPLRGACELGLDLKLFTVLSPPSTRPR